MNSVDGLASQYKAASLKAADSRAKLTEAQAEVARLEKEVDRDNMTLNHARRLLLEEAGK